MIKNPSSKLHADPPPPDCYYSKCPHIRRTLGRTNYDISASNQYRRNETYFGLQHVMRSNYLVPTSDITMRSAEGPRGWGKTGR